MKSKTAWLHFMVLLCFAHQISIAAEGELKLATETPTKLVNLSADGKGDWAHWGHTWHAAEAFLHLLEMKP